MIYALVVVAIALVVAGYLVGERRGRSREQALKTSLEEQSEKLTSVEHELLRRASIDPITQVPTQQFFLEFLEREWRRASRERSTIAVIMIAVDHFGAYNERLGKAEGDSCLRAVASAMKPLIQRPSDTLANYGGPGKFGVVLGRTEREGARILAERLRQAVENLRIPNPTSTTAPTVTITLGLAAIMPDRDGVWQEIELIAAAEKALTEAKESGRNRVTLETAAEPTKTG